MAATIHVHLAASMAQSVYWLSYGLDDTGFDLQGAQEIQTGFVAFPVSYAQLSGISFSRERSGRSVRLISLHLVPSSRMNGTPPYAFMARTGVTCVLHGHHIMATAAAACPHSASYMLVMFSCSLTFRRYCCAVTW